jgi:hypothetical protein
MPTAPQSGPAHSPSVTKSYVPLWSNRSTATVVPAASAGQAGSRAEHKQKRGYGSIVAAPRANPQDAGLIRTGVLGASPPGWF